MFRIPDSESNHLFTSSHEVVQADNGGCGVMGFFPDLQSKIEGLPSACSKRVDVKLEAR